MLGIQKKTVTSELVQAHKKQLEIRALQILLCSRDDNELRPDLFMPGDLIWTWYKSTVQNEKNEWIATTVIDAKPHYIEAKRYTKGRIMHMAYEGVRFIPKGELTQELLACSPEHELGYDINTPFERANQPNSNKYITSLKSIGNPWKATDDFDIYVSNITKCPCDSTSRELHSDLQVTSEHIYNVIGSSQETKRQSSFALSWVIEQAFETEYFSNWDNSYQSTIENDVARDGNTITSHFVYRIETTEDRE